MKDDVLKKDLEARVMQALDEGDALAHDAELAAAMAEPEFAARAAEYEAIDGWLRAWDTPLPPDDELELLAVRIEQRLDEPFDESFDATRPPVFEDEDARVRPSEDAVESGEYSLEALVAPTAPPKVDVSRTGPAPVVDLGARRASSRMPAILAVAAMAGLAMTGAFFSLGRGEPSMEASASTAMMESAEPEADYAEGSARGYAEESSPALQAPAAAAPTSSAEMPVEVEMEPEADYETADFSPEAPEFAGAAEVQREGLGGVGPRDEALALNDPLARPQPTGQQVPARPADESRVRRATAMGRMSSMRRSAGAPHWSQRIAACYLDEIPPSLRIRVTVENQHFVRLLSPAIADERLRGCIESHLRTHVFSVPDGVHTETLQLQ